jgi:putative phosphoesterase
VKIGGVSIYVLHDLKQLGPDPVAERFHVVVSGHSHQPRIDQRDGVLYVNPGSCGPRRFKLPISLGELRISGKSVKAKLVELKLAGV